jgi:hypothetical protein
MGGLCTRSQGGEETTVAKLTVGKDYHEIPGQFVGEGIKKTPAWQAVVTPEQLSIARQEFWRTRRTGRPHIWTTLRSAMDADPGTAQVILQMTEITVQNECIANCVDSQGTQYSIPYFVINDPVKFEVPALKAKPKKEIPANQVLRLKLRVMPSQKECVLEAESASLVKDLKDRYLATPDALGNLTTLKLYFAGREMQDAESLATYNIRNECVIQGLNRG